MNFNINKQQSVGQLFSRVVNKNTPRPQENKAPNDIFILSKVAKPANYLKA